MSDYISIFDSIESGDLQAQRAIRDEIADLQSSIRKAMDRGLTLEEVQVAEALRSAANAAEETLNELV